MISVNYYKHIQPKCTFKGDNMKTSKFVSIFLDDELDEFVSNVIRDEISTMGKTHYYECPANEKLLKKYSINLVDAIKTFVLNSTLHIIKFDKANKTFIDITKILK